MKQVVATIKPCMLDDVIFALHQVTDFPGATTSDVKGIGRGFHQADRSGKYSSGFAYPIFIRLEVICPNAQAEEIIGVILQNAHTGKPDDGKIAVLSVDDASNIATGEHLNNREDL